MKRAATLGILLASAGLSPADEGAPAESKRLKAAYAGVTANPADRKAQSAYLEVFPADASDFSSAFAAEDAQPAGGRGYIALLGDVGKALPEPAFEKLLKIGSLARWEPGYLDELQQVLLKLALAHPRKFGEAFARLRPTEKRRVATFLTDGDSGPCEEVRGLEAKLDVAGHSAAARFLQEEADLSEAHREG